MKFQNKSSSLSAAFVIVFLLAWLHSSGNAQTTKSAAASDFRLTSGRSARNIPFDLYMNLIFLQVRVNDSKTLWFNLDTGLQTTIFDSKQAEVLGLKLEDKSNVKVPGGTIELAFANGVSFSLPGVELSNQRVRTLPLAVFTPVLGRPIHGTIGHDLFNRFVVEIDYAARVINLYEPKDYQYSGRGEIVPVTIEEDEPFLQAKIIQRGRAPIEAKLKIDTGSVNELGLNGSFAQAVKLVSPTQKIVSQLGVGLGGFTENYIARVGDLQIGRLLIKNPVGGYSKDLTRGGDAGTIGGEFFRRFKVIFDYSRGRIILEKNRHFNEPYKYDASGLFLAAEGTNFETLKILRATENTPAFEAGLRDGDVITKIDGNSTSKFSLEQIRQMFTQKGRMFRLTFKRDGSVRQTKIKLRDLI
ncbi:MAG: aspartyl protease family protein [Acidobacteria bacterium]|nr:aspartyl protease family protein [Acidobacteriota bacterium]